MGTLLDDLIQLLIKHLHEIPVLLALAERHLAPKLNDFIQLSKGAVLLEIIICQIMALLVALLVMMLCAGFSSLMARFNRHRSSLLMLSRESLPASVQALQADLELAGIKVAEVRFTDAEAPHWPEQLNQAARRYGALLVIGDREWPTAEAVNAWREACGLPLLIIRPEPGDTLHDDEYQVPIFYLPEGEHAACNTLSALCSCLLRDCRAIRWSHLTLLKMVRKRWVGLLVVNTLIVAALSHLPWIESYPLLLEDRLQPGPWLTSLTHSLAAVRLETILLFFLLMPYLIYLMHARHLHLALRRALATPAFVPRQLPKRLNHRLGRSQLLALLRPCCNSRDSVGPAV